MLGINEAANTIGLQTTCARTIVDLVTLTKVASLLDVDVRQLINKTKSNTADD